MYIIRWFQFSDTTSGQWRQRQSHDNGGRIIMKVSMKSPQRCQTTVDAAAATRVVMTESLATSQSGNKADTTPLACFHATRALHEATRGRAVPIVTCSPHPGPHRTATSHGMKVAPRGVGYPRAKSPYGVRKHFVPGRASRH